jgi:hypothetical protein
VYPRMNDFSTGQLIYRPEWFFFPFNN